MTQYLERPNFNWRIAAGAAALTFLMSSVAVGAENSTPAEPGDGLHVRSALALRAVPIGSKVDLNAGYRWGLSDSESLLLKNTYFEAGVTTTTSPSNFWGGAYVEAVPLAILKLRASARSLNHFGTFGYLYLPENQANPDWSLEAMDAPISAGHAASGYMLKATATLQAKLANVVAMVPFQFSYVNMDVDQVYYETSIDFLLAPTDQVWKVQPTVGYVFSMKEYDTWVMAALRWEHAETIETGLSRDLATAMGLWKLPGTLSSGEMKLVGLGGVWAKHPNREGEPYVAALFSVDWRY